MSRYFEFVQEWVGAGFIFPLLYVFAIFGPFALLFLGSSKKQVFKNIFIFLAACTFFAYFFLCLGTGIYLGKLHGFGGWGIPLGFCLFAGTVFTYVHVEKLVQRVLSHVRS